MDAMVIRTLQVGWGVVQFNPDYFSEKESIDFHCDADHMQRIHYLLVRFLLFKPAKSSFQRPPDATLGGL